MAGIDKISLMVPGDVRMLMTDRDARKVFLDKIRVFGINGIEMMFSEKDDCYRDTDALVDFSEELLNRDMCAPCVDLYVDYLKPGHFDETCRIVDRMIDAMVTLKAPLGMICGSELPKGMEPGKGREIVAEGIDRAIRTGRVKNVNIAIESFGLSYNLQSTTEMLVDLYGKIKECSCFFVGDLGNPCYGGEEPVISLQRFFDKLRHVHVKDVKITEPGKGISASGGYWLDEAELGAGIADVSKSIRFLTKKHYSGWYSLELVYGNNTGRIGEYSSILKQLLRDAQTI